MKRIKATISMLLAFFAIDKIPIAEGKSNFTDDQLEQLKDKVGADMRDQIINAIDKHAEEIAQEHANDEDLEQVRQEMVDFLQENNMSAEELAAITANENGTQGDPTLAEMFAQVVKLAKNQDQVIEKLMNDPEPPTPVAKGTFDPKNKNMHSATHFMASGRNLDAFEGRNWNQRAAGISTTPTNWAKDGPAIDKLKMDIADHYIEVNDRVKSLHRDMLRLPSYFRMRSNVDDRVADGNIVSAEITQARKLPWLPKNNQLIQPEEGKVFPVNIDIAFKGYELQKIETSWLNGWNREGTNPYKLGFVDFLLMELDKKARQEDRIVAINGVYSATPKDATVPGLAIHRGDGLLIQLYRAIYIDKKVKVPTNLGAPTKLNIVDYVTAVIEANLPEEIRNTQGIVYNLSADWLRAYKTRYKQIHGTETGWVAGEEMTIENYPNIRFEIVHDLQNPDFMFITFEDNVELLENVPREKSFYQMDTLRRDIFIYADYKWGARFIHLGTKVDADSPDSFKVQTVWTNGLPMFKKDFFVRVHSEGSSEFALPYSNIKTAPDFAQDITKLTGTYAGQIVKIQGDSNVSKVVKNGTDIVLTGGDFNLNTGGTLTLFIQEDGKAKEVKRTTAPATAPADEEVLFEDDSIDALEGNSFKFNGDNAVTLTEITNGFEGLTITIAAKDGVALTLDSVEGNISVSSQAVLDAAGDYITLVVIDGVFTEVDRNIAS